VTEFYLVDTSAWSNAHVPAVRARLEPLVDAGQVATCAVMDLEALRQARTSAAVEQIKAARVGMRWLSTPDEVWDTVLDVQARLSGSGRRHAVKVPDLIVAAVAHRHGATLMHYDRDFDTIAEITGQPTEWVVPAGSLT
jgi:predicted nucleic acid-binding protein